MKTSLVGNLEGLIKIEQGAILFAQKHLVKSF